MLGKVRCLVGTDKFKTTCSRMKRDLEFRERKTYRSSKRGHLRDREGGREKVRMKFKEDFLKQIKTFKRDFINLQLWTQAGKS